MAGRRFRFTLQKVLELRAWEEKQAETSLAAKTGECTLCQRTIEELLSRRHDAFLRRGGTTIDLGALAFLESFRLRLAREIEENQKRLAQLTIEREDLLQIYLAARRKREVLTKLSEKQALAFRQAEAKRQTLILDDLNTAAYIRTMRPVEEQIG